jgi:ferredoxin
MGGSLSLWAHYHQPMTEKGAPWRVLLLPSGRGFDADGEQTVLAAAAHAGLELPSSCRNGTCRTCLTPLRSGEVHYRIAWPGLLPEERDGGWVLPCVAYASSDLVLQDPGTGPSATQ